MQNHPLNYSLIATMLKDLYGKHVARRAYVARQILEQRDACLMLSAEKGTHSVVPNEVLKLYEFMVIAFVPQTKQQDQIYLALEEAKKAMAKEG